MSGNIHHAGVVERVESGIVYVRIVQQSACAACHAKSACTASEKAEKIVDAENRDNKQYEIGEGVKIIGDRGLGLQAVLIAYVIPICIILAALFISSAITDNELVTGIVGLCSLIPYLILLILFRKKLQSKFRFYIVKL